MPWVSSVLRVLDFAQTGSMVQGALGVVPKYSRFCMATGGVNGCPSLRAKASSRDTSSLQDFPHFFSKYPISDRNLGTYRHEDVG